MNTKQTNKLASMGVRYPNGKVTLYFGPQTGFFQSGFQTTIQLPDHLTTGHKSTILMPNQSGIQIVFSVDLVYKEELKQQYQMIAKKHMVQNGKTR